MKRRISLILILLIICGSAIINSPQSQARPLFNTEPLEWLTFVEPSFGYQISYPSDWHVALTADNTMRADQYEEDVALRSIGFFGPNSQMVFVDVRRNSSDLPLDHWIETYPLPFSIGNQHRLSFRSETLSHTAAKRVTLTPASSTNGAIWHHSTQLAHEDLVFNIESASLESNSSVYDKMLASFRLITPTQSRSSPSLILDILPPAEYGIQTASCCGITDPEYNPFPCNSAQNMGNCTWWARYSRRGTNEANLYNCTGNANTWDECAAQYYPHLLSDIPLQASVIVWMGSSDNHVAFVESMTNSTQYQVSQMGWSQTCPQSYYSQTHNSIRYEYIHHPNNQNTCCGCTAALTAAAVLPLGGELIGPPAPGTEPVVAFDLTAPGDLSTVPSHADAVENGVSLPPVLSASPNEYYWSSNSTQTALTWPAATDDGTGVAGYRVYWGPDENGTSDIRVSEPAFAAAFPNTGIDAVNHYLRVAPVDNTGNLGLWQTVHVWRYDGQSPSGSMQINGGGSIVPMLPVVLNLSAADEHSGVTAMRFSSDGQNWTEWEPYAAQRNWQINDTHTAQTIYAQFRDGAGNVSSTVSTSVTADLSLAPPTSTNYRIARSVMGMGGGAKSSSTYRLQGTSGQPYQTGLMQSGSYRVASGYWGQSSTPTNQPPNPPSNPSPVTNATNVAITTALSWSATDPNNDTITYAVHFGTSSDPLQVASQSAATYDPPGNLANGTTYYWKIVASDGKGGVTPGPVWSFTTVAAPGAFPNNFFISPATSTAIGGIPSTPADILLYEKAANRWTMVYDGSVRGTLKNVTAFDIMDDGSLLLVFGVNQPLTINGAAVTATPYDIVRFTPNNPGVFPLGPGAYTWFFQGKTKGLTTLTEKIDALDVVADRILLSTVGAAAVPLSNGTVLKAADEDVFVFNKGTNQWENQLLIDGSKMPGMAVEDITSIWHDPETGDYYITINGAFSLGGVKGNGKSIVKLTPNGGPTEFTPSIVPWLAPGATFPSTLDGLDIAP